MSKFFKYRKHELCLHMGQALSTQECFILRYIFCSTKIIVYICRSFLIRDHQEWLFITLQWLFIFFKILFIYSRGTQKERQRHRQKEKQSPYREPDVELDPGFPGLSPTSGSLHGSLLLLPLPVSLPLFLCLSWINK